jgi:antitoxin CptB
MLHCVSPGLTAAPPAAISKPARSTSMSEEIENRRRRLTYRSSYTGMKETDILLGAFARRYLPDFSAEQLERYEALLESRSDPELYAWATGRKVPPPELRNDVVELLCNFNIGR